MTRRPLFVIPALRHRVGIASPMPVAAQPSNDSSTIEIGLVKQFFNDVPDVMIKIATEPFGDLMKDVTGFQGKLCYKSDAFEIARKLDKGEFQIGVFHGHEFAWLQKAYPKLRPLMLAVNQYSEVRAYVVVNKTNEAKDLKALRGKSIDVPLLTKEHCNLFLEKACTDNAQQARRRTSRRFSVRRIDQGDRRRGCREIGSGADRHPDDGDLQGRQGAGVRKVLPRAGSVATVPAAGDRVQGRRPCGRDAPEIPCGIGGRS